MTRPRKYTEEELINAIKNNDTIADALRELKLVTKGDNYKTIHKAVKRLNLDTSHWLGCRKSFKRDKIPLDDILKGEYPSYKTGNLKKRIIDDGLMEEECDICDQESKWEGKKLVLILDHINGINNDHRLENLRLLCPNCNSQTETFAGRNKKRYRREVSEGVLEEVSGNRIFIEDVFCDICKVSIHRHTKSKLCSGCSQKKKNGTLHIPSKEILLKEVEESNFCAVGRKYGVSDNAIRKRIK